MRRTIVWTLALGMLLAVACAAEVQPIVRPSPTPTDTPTYTPTATHAPVPTPTASPTETPTSTLTATPSPLPTPTPAETPTPEPIATPKPTSQEPVEMVATGNVDVFLSPGGQKVGYFVPGQRFTPTGVEENGWIQVGDSDGNTLWIQEGGPYAPVSEEPQEYVVLQQIDLYESPNEASYAGHIIPGKRFTIVEQQGEWIKIRVWEPQLETSWERWIKVSETAYALAGEVPPSPAVCEIPHFPDRTTDRGTGYIDRFGEYRQYIFPDRAYEMRWINISSIGGWVSRRDARIIAVDRQNQTVTFQLSDGSSVQRRFVESTIAIMVAHEWRAPMMEDEAFQRGGNICDLEVGDVVSILNPNEAESAHPNPNLVDLWGIFFVQ